MSTSLLAHFASLEDPRVERNQRHALLDIVLLTVCAVVSGARTARGSFLFTGDIHKLVSNG